MRKRSNVTFVVLLIGMASTAAVLIVSIPPLFGSPEPQQVWTTGLVGGLTVALAIGVLRLRPTQPRPADRDDE